jgi:hypothetical protein
MVVGLTRSRHNIVVDDPAINDHCRGDRKPDSAESLLPSKLEHWRVTS